MSSATKSKVSAMVSGAGMAADVWTRLDRAVKAQGGTDDDLHLLAREEGQPMIDMIAGLLVKAGAAPRNVYPVIIKPFDILLEDGKYGYANEYITSANFPFTAKEGDTAQLVLVHFDRDISSEDAVKEMAQMGLEPAKVEHLMAYGAQHWQGKPELVVALGSSWVYPYGLRRVPCLRAWYGGRDLDLDCWGGGWVRATVSSPSASRSPWTLGISDLSVAWSLPRTTPVRTFSGSRRSFSCPRYR